LAKFDKYTFFSREFFERHFLSKICVNYNHDVVFIKKIETLSLAWGLYNFSFKYHRGNNIFCHCVDPIVKLYINNSNSTSFCGMFLGVKMDYWNSILINLIDEVELNSKVFFFIITFFEILYIKKCKCVLYIIYISKLKD